VNEPPEETEPSSFSELTVELIEQAASLMGERISAPVRTAGAAAARLLTYGASIVAVVGVGLVFLGLAIGHLVAMAPEPSRWWICLLIAVGFFLAAAITALIVFPRRTPRRAEATGEPEE
jgi:ABC-type multidrug transport system permease subunit